MGQTTEQLRVIARNTTNHYDGDPNGDQRTLTPDLREALDAPEVTQPARPSTPATNVHIVSNPPLYFFSQAYLANPHNTQAVDQPFTNSHQSTANPAAQTEVPPEAYIPPLVRPGKGPGVVSADDELALAPGVAAERNIATVLNIIRNLSVEEQIVDRRANGDDINARTPEQNTLRNDAIIPVWAMHVTEALLRNAEALGIQLQPFQLKPGTTVEQHQQVVDYLQRLFDSATYSKIAEINGSLAERLTQIRSERRELLGGEGEGDNELMTTSEIVPFAFRELALTHAQEFAALETTAQPTPESQPVLDLISSERAVRQPLEILYDYLRSNKLSDGEQTIRALIIRNLGQMFGATAGLTDTEYINIALHHVAPAFRDIALSEDDMRRADEAHSIVLEIVEGLKAEETPQAMRDEWNNMWLEARDAQKAKRPTNSGDSPDLNAYTYNAGTGVIDTHLLRHLLSTQQTIISSEQQLAFAQRFMGRQQGEEVDADGRILEARANTSVLERKLDYDPANIEIARQILSMHLDFARMGAILEAAEHPEAVMTVITEIKYPTADGTTNSPRRSLWQIPLEEMTVAERKEFRARERQALGEMKAGEDARLHPALVRQLLEATQRKMPNVTISLERQTVESLLGFLSEAEGNEILHMFQ